MKILTLSSYHDLEKFIDDKIENGVKVVSFDVFDTLIHRRIDPRAIQQALLLFAKTIFKEEGVTSSQNIEALREEAYQELIHLKAKMGLDLDVTLAEWNQCWIEKLLTPGDSRIEEIAKLMEEYEVAFESSVIFANKKMQKLVQRLNSKNVRVIYTSDMYLGKKNIDRLLAKVGYEDCFDKAYVSGDYSLLKRTGRLFKKVLEEEGVEATQLVHIGDNLTSDGEMAINQGIHACVFADPIKTKSALKKQFDWEMLSTNHGWWGVIASQFSEVTDGEELTAEEMYGRRVLGPIYTTFVHAIIDRCLKYNIERIYFLSREGHILKRIYDTLIESAAYKDQNLPVSEYLGCSRLAAFTACMKDYSLREILAVRSNNAFATIKNLFAPVKIEEPVLSKIATRYGFANINSPLPGNFIEYPPFLDLIEDRELKLIIGEQADEAEEGLISYLKSRSFFNFKKVALVDVGWSGQIQKNLYRAAHKYKSCPTIFGFYLGMTLKAHWEKNRGTWSEWTHADQCHLGWSGNAAFDFVQGLEAVIRANHPTVIGYHSLAGVYEPKLKSFSEQSRRIEQKDDLDIALMQGGICQYASLYMKLHSMFGFSSEDTLPYSKLMLNRMVRFPLESEARRLLQLANVSDLGSSEVLRLGNNEDSLKTLNVFKIRRRLKSTFWQFGELALSSPAVLKPFLIAWLCAKRQPSSYMCMDPDILCNTPLSLIDEPGSKTIPLLAKQGTDSFWSMAEESFVENMQKGRARKGKIITNFSEPLNSRELINLVITYKLVLIFCKVLKRKIPIQDTLSFKLLLLRELCHSNNIQSKILKMLLS